MGWRAKVPAGLISANCLLFVLALSPRLWWFLAAIVALLAALWSARRKLPAMPESGARTAPLESGTVLSLILYAALASIALITVRAALGWLERPTPPFEQLPLPAYTQSSVLGFYDKSELRLALYEMLLFTVALGLAFVRSAGFWALETHRSLRLHPETAVFSVALYFSAVYLPPYGNFNITHWFPFIAGATAIQNGVWPYFSGLDFGYGLLGLAFLSVWLSAFGLSSLSLSAVIMLSDLVAGTATYVLIRKLTGSRMIALLGASFLLYGATETLVVTSTFRAPIQIAISSLLLYSSLRGRRHGVWAGVLFGLGVLWNPTFGIFAAVSFVLVHAYRCLHGDKVERASHLRSLAAMFAGIVLPLAMIWMYTGPAASHLSEFYAGSGGALFLLGYANVAQRFDPLVIPAAMLGVLYMALVLYRLTRSRRLTVRTLFVGASMISAVPYVIYATGRSDWSHQLAAYWALTPSMALLFYGLVRLLSVRQGEYAVRRMAVRKRIGLTNAALLVFFLTLYPFAQLSTTIAGYTTGNEPAKEKWYTDCAAGKGCDISRKPTLRNHLRDANQALLHIDARFAAACREGTTILSSYDALIYASAHCYPASGLPTVNLIVTRGELDRYVKYLETREHILFDGTQTAYTAWKGDMLGEIKSRLLRRGYAESPGCGRIAILSKGNPATVARNLCG